MRLRIYFLSLILFWSCGPEPIPEPQATILIAPADLNECTTATVLSETESQVKFQWTLALNTDSYELVVVNTLTNARYGKTSALLTESIILPSGAPYRWYVNSKSLLSTAVGKSSVRQFYLEGSQDESYLPFPAVLLQPENQSTVDLEISGNFSFDWEGYDLDEDIESFAIYLGKSEDDLELVQESLTDSQLSLSLDAGERYFWQIITLDSEGNTSKSEVYSFQTAG
jgi:hypothetical protein